MPHAEPVDTRDRILDAAEHAFSEQGLAGARVAAIAAEAGVNKAMLFYYFGSKEGLYDAVLARMGDEVVSMAEAALSDASLPPEERLFAFLEGYRALLAARPKFVRIVMHELLAGGGRLKTLFGPRVPRVLFPFWQCVQQGQAQGTLNPALDHRIILPALVAPFVLFNAAASSLQGILPIDTEAARASFERTVLAIARDGVLLHRSPEDA
jgi:AcrR family transcriptional regulator